MGIAGTILSEAQSRGVYEFLKDWQTLIGALVALTAALLAIRPVWAQLEELRRQSSQRHYEQMTGRSILLHKEREALYALTSAVDIMLQAIAALPSYNPIGGLTAQAVASIAGPDNYVRDTVSRFKQELGPIWGTPNVQRARATMLDETLRFRNELTKLTERITIGNRISAAEMAQLTPPLLNHKTALFTAAETLHRGIVLETERLGPIISALEEKLF
ncbi:MAG: hypothetical protein Q7V17_13850 [Afipia sp.]|nr:hypothetical protein [Afipia sp.]